MSAINPDEIISILKEEIKNYDEISKDQEVWYSHLRGRWDCYSLWDRPCYVWRGGSSLKTV